MRVLDDVLARFLFLRQYMLYTDVNQAIASFALGIWVGLRLSSPESAGDERFCEVLATWMRALQSPTARMDLFRSPEEADLFSLEFLRFWQGR
jgi:hypothetical protein